MEMGFNKLSDMCCILKLQVHDFFFKSTTSTLSVCGGRLCSQSQKSSLKKRKQKGIKSR